MSSASAVLFRSMRPGVVAVAVATALGFGMLAGLHPARLAVLCLVVATGQAATGMSADWRPLPASREGAAHSSGDAPLRRLRGWSLALTFVSVALGIVLGPWAALVMTVLLTWCWGYNLWLRQSMPSLVLDLSWFALVPVLAAVAHAEPRLAPWWQLAVGLAVGIVVYLGRLRLTPREPRR